jgi:predicted TIM-barrel fold metal-dependent hydrolase
MSNRSGDPVVLVSCDTHVGPRLVEDLRPYCPASHLDDFDRFAAAQTGFGSGLIPDHPNLHTAGHYESAARLADYDRDGVAAGVLFHGSQNSQPLPFRAFTFGGPDASFDPDLEAVGLHVYNRWLVDFVAEAPDRHIGLAQIPAWDVDASVAEVEWAHDAGLRAVNFPGMRPGVILEYSDRAWEPFWSTCEERGMPLATHVGAANVQVATGPEAIMISTMEGGGWMARRAMWWMIFAGVFERHPGLQLVITETPGNWWPTTAAELDSIYDMTAVKGRAVLPALFEEQVPRHPSEYMAANVYFGASFTSTAEADTAIMNGVDSRLLWGSDYPHVEGTFVHDEHGDMPSVTRQALRNTFCEIAEDRMREMVGGNAIRAYRLDEPALQRIARDIGAPTAAEIATPIDQIPVGASTHAFRTTGVWT